MHACIHTHPICSLWRESVSSLFFLPDLFCSGASSASQVNDVTHQTTVNGAIHPAPAAFHLQCPQAQKRNSIFPLSAQSSTAPTTQRFQPGKQEAAAQSRVWTQPPSKKNPMSSAIPTHPKTTLDAYLARSSLRQLRSWAEVRVVACVRWACWKWPARRLASTAFLHMSSSGTLACAPTSFRATSDSTLRPSASTSTHIMQPSSWEGKPMICGDRPWTLQGVWGQFNPLQRVGWSCHDSSCDSKSITCGEWHGRSLSPVERLMWSPYDSSCDRKSITCGEWHGHIMTAVVTESLSPVERLTWSSYDSSCDRKSVTCGEWHGHIKTAVVTGSLSPVERLTWSPYDSSCDRSQPNVERVTWSCYDSSWDWQSVICGEGDVIMLQQLVGALSPVHHIGSYQG